MFEPGPVFLHNYVLGELKRYVRINTEELNFLKIKNNFFLRIRNRGFRKNLLTQWFSQVRYSNRTKFLDGNPEDICYYQGTRETMVDTTLIKIGEGIRREALGNQYQRGGGGRFRGRAYQYF